MSPKVYECKIRVRGYELDSFGHVNNAVYLNYLEVARWQMLEDEGITLKLIQAEKRWPVIAGIDIKYHRPSFMSDELLIKTQVVEMGKIRFKIDQKIYRDQTLIATAMIESVVVDENGRPMPTPDKYREVWGSGGRLP